jgi:hypothetical protein
VTAYTVTRIVDATQTLTVDIDDKGKTPDQIMGLLDDAVDAHPDAMPGLCFQCADEVDLGDPGKTVSIMRGSAEFWDDMGGFK